jgi:hypothetical protein
MLMSMRMSFFSHVLAAVLVGSVNADCPVGDLNGDCQVDSLDVRVLAQEWLSPPERSADLNGDDRVNMADFGLLAEQWHQAGIPLVINELMASNSSCIRDPQHEYDDWIEIYNFGTDAVDTGGMYLTDDPARPRMWRIPGNNSAATTIPAGGYLLIWADDDTADAGLHANFKLSAGGEQIALFDSDGVTLIDSVTFGDQTTDISYGRHPDANDNRRFFGFPSPGAENIGVYLGFVDDVQFSHKRGFYDTSFSVTLATETEDATIYCTLDGTEPYELGGRFPTGTIYTGPIPVGATTCLRAKAVRHGWKSSDIKTYTYIFLDDVIASSVMSKSIIEDPVYGPQMRDALTDLPTVSIATPPGVLEPYLHGPGPYPEWTYDEVPASVEWIMPDGTAGFQENAGVSRFGGHWYDKAGKYRPFDKWSYRIYFRREYGATKLRFPLFEGHDYGISPVEVFDQLDLHAGHHDMSQRGFYMSSRITEDTMLEMGNINPHGRFVHLYLNGVYWGQYNLHERWNADMNAQYLGGEKEDYESIKTHVNQGGWGDLGEPYDGDGSAWQQVLSRRNSYEAIKPYLDFSSYVDFMLMYMFGRSEPEFRCVGPTGPGSGFKFWLNDADGFTRSASNRASGSSINGPGGIFIALFNEANPDYLTFLADRIHKHLFNDGALTSEKMTTKLLERCNEVERAFLAEAARWGYRTPSSWAGARDSYINNVLPYRPASLVSELRAAGFYPTTDAPEFNKHGGDVPSGFNLTMRAPANAVVYYTVDGSDPRLPEISPDTTSDTLIAENDSKRVLVPMGPLSDNWKSGGAFNDLAWLQCAGSPGGVGYERSSGYQQLIGLDVEEQMYSTNTTCYIRIPFTFNGSPDDFDFVTLKVRYDDGFIAYLNGTEVARRNFNGVPAWNSSASASHSDSEAVLFEDIDISSSLGALQRGTNLLAIHGMNSSTTSSDLLISVELVVTEGGSAGAEGVSPTATRYTAPTPLPHSAQVKARVLQGNTWSALNEAVYAAGPVAENLRITEIMYHPRRTDEPNDPNEEFIELTNIGAETINLNLVSFTNGIDFTFPSINLAAGEHIVVVQDRSAFEARYGTNVNVAGRYTGRLGNAGERIRLEDAIGRTILDFSYKDGWRAITDDEGFSLTIIDAANPDPNSWGQKDSWRPSAYTGGSPGTDDSGILPNPGAVVINELLAHSHDVAADWIEFYNTTSNTIDISGWFLSDSNSNLAKYEFPAGTKIGPYKYLVLSENLHFGNQNAPGCHEPFALSENGEEVYLSSAENGVLTGYRNIEDFGASATGVSFGRYYKASTDNYNFAPMQYNTRGYANADPLVGPIVISEIMYNPDWPEGGSYTNDQYEYIELHNISAAPVKLYNDLTDEPWKLTAGVEFTFPDDPAVTIPAGGSIVIVKNVEAFTWRYPSVPAAKILGPYDGKLNNAGERLELGMPGDVDRYGERQYIRVDRVGYSDGSHPEDCPGGVDLWPTEPDGSGQSLTRKVLTDYGNDPHNWLAAAPSPGE